MQPSKCFQQLGKTKMTTNKEKRNDEGFDIAEAWKSSINQTTDTPKGYTDIPIRFKLRNEAGADITKPMLSEVISRALDFYKDITWEQLGEAPEAFASDCYELWELNSLILTNWSSKNISIICIACRFFCKPFCIANTFSSN